MRKTFTLPEREATYVVAALVGALEGSELDLLDRDCAPGDESLSGPEERV